MERGLQELFEKHRSQEGSEQLRRVLRERAASQAPKVMVISCCDSRVDPQQLLGAAPGEIFVLRRVAALVGCCDWQDGREAQRECPDLCAQSALEFAIGSLGVRDLVILGHSNCGGARAARALSKRLEAAQARATQQATKQGTQQGYKEKLHHSIEAWVEPFAMYHHQCKSCSALKGEASEEQDLRSYTEAMIDYSHAQVCKNRVVAEAMEQKRLRTHRWYYDLEQADFAILS